MKELATKFKARGKDGEGQIHTGWLSVYFLKGELKTYIQEEAEENKPAMTFYVEPESIAQFVGYDADGNEIYEGDKVQGINGTMDGHTFTARRDNVVQSTNGMYWAFQSEDVRKDSVENEKN